jgi:hypothetical protein
LRIGPSTTRGTISGTSRLRDCRRYLTIVARLLLSCGWRIVISPMIPHDFASCCHSSMRDLVVLLIHLLATLVRLLGPGGVRSLLVESLLLKHQRLIVNRSRQRSQNLSASDRLLAGLLLLALLVRPTRLLRSAIALKPSTVQGFAGRRGPITCKANQAASCRPSSPTSPKSALTEIN